MADPRYLNHGSFAAPLGGLGVAVPSDLGFSAWSDPPSGCVTSGAGPAGASSLALRRISLPGPMVVNNVAVIIGTAGVALTANQCFMGAWDGNGVFLGLTADQSVNFGGTGLNNQPIIPSVNGNGVDTPYMYVGVWFNGTTSPFYIRAQTADIALQSGLASVSAQNARAVTAAGVFTTSGTAPNQLGVLTKNASLNGGFWCAVS